MPDGKRLNYYGFMGLFAALTSFGAYMLIHTKDCRLDAYGDAQIIHLAGCITGGILFILGFLNIAGILYDIKLVFFAVIIAIIAVGGVSFYAAYILFINPCSERILGLINKSAFEDNSFTAKDTVNIGALVLDVFSGLILLSIGFAFGKRL